MKKLLCVLLALVMTAVLFGSAALAADGDPIASAPPTVADNDRIGDMPAPISEAPPMEEIVPIGPVPDEESIVPFGPVPDIATLTFSEDGASARLTGSADGLYARAALALDINGESGLYITQVPIGSNGVIVIPELLVPGVTVTGVSIALVSSLADITSPAPEPVLFAVR